MPFAFAGFALLVISGLLLDAHTRRWRTERQQLLSRGNGVATTAWRSCQAQFRRRMQASGMVGVLGLLLGLRDALPATPMAAAGYLLLLLTGCLYMVVLAIIDAWAGMVRINRARSDRESASVQLEAELQKARDRRARVTSDVR